MSFHLPFIKILVAYLMKQNFYNNHHKNLPIEVINDAVIFNQLFTNSPDLICIFSIDGFIKLANPSVVKFMGFSQKELTSKPFLEFVQPKDRERIQSEITQLITEKKKLKFEIQTINRKGDYVWARWSAVTTEDGLICAIGKDITEDKRIHQEINYQKEILKAIFDHIPLMIMFYDANGRIIASNKELEKELGWTLTDLQKVDVIEKSFPDKRRRIEVLNLMRKTLPEWRDFEVRTKLGRFKTISWYNIHLSDGSNIAIGKDVTSERKSDQAKREFLSAVSHELKTPITTLKLMCEAFKRRYEMQKNKDPKNDFRIIKNELDRITRLVDDLLDLSRYETGELNYRFEAVKLNLLLEDVVKKIKHLSPRHKIELFCDEDQEILADTHRFEQVLANLIANAVKFSPKGKAIIIRCIRKGKNVILSVQDFGIGIPILEQKNIFDRFYQTDKIKRNGFGLGLYISKEIIERHKGKIWVKSEINKGSTFYLKLPIFDLK